MKRFNTTGPCIPTKHYMVDLTERLEEIRGLVAEGAYFTINRARQYGKTTTLAALARTLSGEYQVISLDFQKFSQSCFRDERSFCISFAAEFSSEAKRTASVPSAMEGQEILLSLDSASEDADFNLYKLFRLLLKFCEASEKPVVLMVDEVDSASNNQVFLDFLAQLRSGYLDRDLKNVETFQSVILAGLYDVRNIRRKIRPEEDHKVNSPWNIASDFDIRMGFSEEEIAGMLREYEDDCHTGMDIPAISRLLYDYTSGYPFLVSRLCKLTDEKVCEAEAFIGRSRAWTLSGIREAVRLLLAEKNLLFDSMIGKLGEYPELNRILRSLLFAGRTISYNADEPAINLAAMLGFVRNHQGNMEIANRIFETRLYNFYLSSSEMQEQELCKVSMEERNQFVVDGHLNMRRILERFVVHFGDLYADCDGRFLEEEGRKYFLLYLRPIINGTGNYYIESRTRGLRRTDVIVDYRGEQYIIELKIWHGKEYQCRGEKQLVDYLEDYHQNKGYMVSFNFNQKKAPGVYEMVIGDKTLIEAVV